MDYWYDYKLVALSVVVAVIASQISLAIASRIKAHRSQVAGWLLGGASAMGIGIWAMHFIGMLAYHLPVPLGYDIPLTLFSLLLAIISSMIALYVIFSSSKLDWSSNALSALMMGGGIAGMHYTGIYAMQMSPPVMFDTTLFLLSLLIAYAASFVAIRFAFVYSRSDTFFDLKKSVAALIMGVAIAGMHYTAMGALRIDPDALCLAANGGMSVELLAALVIAVVLVILMITALVLNSDLKLSQREKGFAMQLAEQNKRSLAEAQQLATDLSRESLRNATFANKLIDTLGVIVVVLDREGLIIRFNHTAEQVTGFDRKEVIGRSLWEQLVPPEQRLDILAVFESLVDGVFPNTHTNHWMTSSGERRLIDWANTALLDAEGKVEFIIASGIDVTEQRANEVELKIAAVAFNTNEGIVVTDLAGNILRANRMFTEITGYEADEAIGRNASLLKSGRHDEAFYRDMWSQLVNRGFWVGEIWNKRKNGEIYPELLRINVVKDSAGSAQNYVASFSDVSQLKHAEEQLTYVSNYDLATGLPNRQLFAELLHKEIATVRPLGESGLLFYMRFVQLGLLNESLGIAVLDEFIERFIEKVREQCGAGGVLGRASGSSFLLALPRIEAAYDLPSRGSQLAEAIIQFASSGELVDGNVVRLSLNIGIATFPQEGLGAQELIQNAFVALERAKQGEGSHYHFFSDELHQAAVDSYTMEVALRAAIGNGELMLYFQPQVERQGRVRGAEALLRWNHQGKFISPVHFIPMAERSDLIHEIGNFVFREGISELARLLAAGLPVDFDCISLNMSAKQFQDTCFIDNLKKNLIEFAVPPEYIKIELTETTLVADPQQAVATINTLKELGIRISLDDFGTGYSSLSYLHRIPIDQLKIDQSFVRDITINKVSRSITETIITMANSMEIDVIAEGVETKEEWQLLESFGCYHYQGYYFYKPMPAAEFAALLLREVEVPSSS
jgi:PAS domain S-box-containing protein/diguanylate cyclase (GGDEF)-like protein